MFRVCGALLISLVFSVILSVPALSLSLGMAPNVADLGTVERGSSYIVDAYIISDYGRDLMVDLNTGAIGSKFLDPGRARQTYEFVPSEASEEDITGWLRYIENPVLLKTEKRGYVLKDGAVINANKRATVVVGVPEDAEPGYHACYIEPSPRVTMHKRGTGTDIITVARMVVVLYVPGDPVRSVYIESFETERINPYVERVRINVRNNGTTTIIARSNDMRIYGEEGLLEKMKSSFISMAPGETASLISNWNVKGLEPGEYEISAGVSWTTGGTEKEGAIRVHRPPAMTTGEIIEEPGEFPYWIMFLGIVIIGLIIIYRDRT